MFDYLDGPGFFGGHSSAGADLSLVVTLAAMVMLTVGVFLARSRRYQAHRWVQTAAVCIGAVPVIVWMIRSFGLYVVPGLPGNLDRYAEALTTVHAVAGTAGLVVGAVVAVRANQLMARSVSLAGHKQVMRVAYGVYLLATALGIWVFIALYG